MTPVRYPFPADLDQQDASFETEEGELVAGLAHLDTLAVNRIGQGAPATSERSAAQCPHLDAIRADIAQADTSLVRGITGGVLVVVLAAVVVLLIAFMEQ